MCLRLTCAWRLKSAQRSAITRWRSTSMAGWMCTLMAKMMTWRRSRRRACLKPKDGAIVLPPGSRNSRYVLTWKCICPHTEMHVSSFLCVVSSRKNTCVLISLCVCPQVKMHVSSSMHTCVLTLKYMCPHFCICVSSRKYACVLKHTHMRPQAEMHVSSLLCVRLLT